MAGLVVVSAPAEEVLTLAEVKAHLRIDTTREDARLPHLITAAQEEAAVRCGLQFVRATYDLFLDAFPDVIDLPRPPLASVTSVSYVDAQGVTQVLPATSYAVGSRGPRGRIMPAYGLSWPTTRQQAEAVTVRFLTGYATASVVPAWVKAAIKLLVTDLFEQTPESNKGRKLAEQMLRSHALWPPQDQ